MTAAPASPPVTSARTEDLTPDLRAAIVALCVAAHQEPDFNHLFTYIPSGGRHFLAYAGDRLVSHAVVTPRWLLPQGQPRLRTAYVDAVATQPEFQGQGYGSAALRLLAQSIDDYAIACLETDRPGFYERLGWELWRGPLAGQNELGLVPTPDQTGIMVLRLPHTPPLNLDRALTIEMTGGRIW